MGKYKYLIKKDKDDDRDIVSDLEAKHLPSFVDLRQFFGPVFDQGQLGSCTGNGTAALLGYMENKKISAWQVFSRLFIYWHERQLEGSIDEDAGADIRDGMKVLQKIGAPLESYWPYHIDQFRVQPSAIAEAQATSHKINKYHRVLKLSTAKAALAHGHPIVIGFLVYNSFESEEVARTGIVPMPKADEKQLGGHCVLIVGYDDEKQCFIVRNSWGEGWGDKGYCYLPYQFIESEIIMDMWIAQ